MSEADEPGTVSVLVVCTGNICRSPFAAARLEETVPAQAAAVLSIDSAGVSAAHGYGRCDGLRMSLGLALPPDRDPVQVEAEMLARADLVLALTSAHRAELLQIAPAVRKKLFTLIEAANIAEGILDAEHALGIASSRGDFRVLDRDDPLLGVPPLPDGPEARLRWLIGELDAWRGAGATEIDEAVEDARPGAGRGDVDDYLSVPDPHLAGNDIHPDTAVMIDLAVKRLAAGIDRLLAA